MEEDSIKRSCERMVQGLSRGFALSYEHRTQVNQRVRIRDGWAGKACRSPITEESITHAQSNEQEYQDNNRASPFFSLQETLDPCSTGGRESG